MEAAVIMHRKSKQDHNSKRREGSGRRDSIPAAIASCNCGIKTEDVFNSGVSKMPPIAQIETKKNPQTARTISSECIRNRLVALFRARVIASPDGVPSSRQPATSQNAAT